MNKSKKIFFILKILKKNYPNAKCFLKFSAPHELLVAARLSAQCSDKKVNEITSILFKKFSSLNSFANANFVEIFEIVKPCGLANKKTNDIINFCQILVTNFNSKIPNSMEKLLQLPGIGRKTANLILSTLFKQPTIVVDTHVLRIANRLNLVNSKNAKIVEMTLLKIVPKKHRVKFCHRLILFGRQICKARKPKCNFCEFKMFCKFLNLE